jgi:hypothetical protein
VLDARFDCLRSVGNGREWAAEPEEIVDYILVRRAASVKDVQTQGNCLSFRLELGDIPTAVKCREISLTAYLGSAKSRPPTVLVDGKADAKIDSFVEDILTFTWSVKTSQMVELNWAT